MSNQKLIGRTFVSGPIAKTDLHNGGTIFGIVYDEYLQFMAGNQVQSTNRVTFNRGMQDWQDAKEKEHWIGCYKVDSDNKNIRCELAFGTAKKILYVSFIDDGTLLCEEYLPDEQNGKGRIFVER